MTKKYIETSNVAEVVRCWECEYYYFLVATKKKAGRCKKFGTDGSGPDLSPYDFCSFGKPLPDRHKRGKGEAENNQLLAAAPVQNGEWIDTPDNTTKICSYCKADWNVFDNETYRFYFCPNCGAIMDFSEG